MKYFTKYLPFEGGFRRVVKSNGIPIDYEQEVKLFFCCRDIQIGDKFTQGELPMTYPTARFTCVRYAEDGDPIDDEGHCYAKETVYVILHEVPKELNLTAGEEFNELP